MKLVPQRFFCHFIIYFVIFFFKGNAFTAEAQSSSHRKGQSSTHPTATPTPKPAFTVTFGNSSAAQRSLVNGNLVVYTEKPSTPGVSPLIALIVPILLGSSGLGFYLTYRYNLWKIQLDTTIKAVDYYFANYHSFVEARSLLGAAIKGAREVTAVEKNKINLIGNWFEFLLKLNNGNKVIRNWIYDVISGEVEAFHLRIDEYNQMNVQQKSSQAFQNVWINDWPLVHDYYEALKKVSGANKHSKDRVDSTGEVVALRLLVWRLQKLSLTHENARLYGELKQKEEIAANLQQEVTRLKKEIQESTASPVAKTKSVKGESIEAPDRQRRQKKNE